MKQMMNRGVVMMSYFPKGFPTFYSMKLHMHDQHSFYQFNPRYAGNIKKCTAILNVIINSTLLPKMSKGSVTETLPFLH
ncbi:hypothetical protein DP73_11375 [Desulfosporosinus sp. HMP52]|nr:hypothetical protein DP73_11375 [Desulfosporosinus sp. HMP52]